MLILQPFKAGSANRLSGKRRRYARSAVKAGRGLFDMRRFGGFPEEALFTS
jgi:hypothetical protein